MNIESRLMMLRILRPLVRFLLRNGVLFHQFMDIVKWVYVDVAFESKITGKKQTKSRVSVLTGLSRVEVAKQTSREIHDMDDGEKWHRAGRVLSAWASESDYQDDNGKPLVIAIEGDTPCFEDLVTRHSGGSTVRAILDELVRVEAVKRNADDSVSLLRPFYLVDEAEQAIQQMQVVGFSAGSLLETLEHNTRDSQTDLRFQRLVFEEDLPVSTLDDLRSQLRESGQSWANQTDALLTEQKAAATKQPSGDKGTARVGMGIYYFEQPDNDPDILNTEEVS